MLAEGKRMNQSNQTKPNTIFQTRILAEIAVFSALSAVLYTVRPFTLPFGGSITLGSMVPVMWLSMRRGIRVGITAGVIFGIIALLIDALLVGVSNVIVNPLQAGLEYPLASGLLGLTGIFGGLFQRKTVGLALAGATLSVFLKFLVHYFAGVYVWWYVYAFPGGWGPYVRYIWPAIYNGSFLLVELIVSSIILSILIRRGTLNYRL
jgi:thiamine transporter